MKSKRTEVTIETHEIWIIKRPPGDFIAWCAWCGLRVHMISAEEAGILTGLNLRAVYRQVDNGMVHYTEMPGGSLLICANSIIGGLRTQATRFEANTPGSWNLE